MKNIGQDMTKSVETNINSVREEMIEMLSSVSEDTLRNSMDSLLVIYKQPNAINDNVEKNQQYV